MLFLKKENQDLSFIKSIKKEIQIMKKIKVIKNRYVDSVTLMSIGSKVLEIEGIKNADVYMGTPSNLEILTSMNYELPDDIGPGDLVMAVTGESEEKMLTAFQMMEDIIDHKLPGENQLTYNSLDEINLSEDPYDLVQISLPGEFAFAEAKKALEMGLNVFIFSDNVSLEEELELKQLGREKNLLVMGPDSGVGLLNGVCLAAGSILKKGPVGIVAASGSGAQEVGCIVERCGLGVSSIIGTGGRDLYPEIGGISMIQGISYLEKDPDTQVMVLVSKLADPGVMEKVLKAADEAQKPVVAVFLGSDEELFKGHRVTPAFSLEEAALKACEIVMNRKIEIGYADDEIDAIVKGEMAKFTDEQRYFRGLYCGGTFTEESLIYFSENVPGITLYSNLKTKYAIKLGNHHESKGHCILDLGSEDFTRESPHPVFDPALRIKRLCKELEDPQVAVILLDFITGPGVAKDPISPFIDVIKEHNKKNDRHITYIVNICGSSGDPQNVLEKTALLKQAEVITTISNYESARLAGALMNALERRQVDER